MGINTRLVRTSVPDGECSERQNYGDVILVNRLQQAIEKLNPEIPSSAREQALKNILRLPSLDLISNNEAFHKMLSDGIEVEYRQDGDIKGDKVWLADFEHPEKNEFLVVNQFTVIENNSTKRPDVVLFINGLPLVVMELKKCAKKIVLCPTLASTKISRRMIG